MPIIQGKSAIFFSNDRPNTTWAVGSYNAKTTDVQLQITTKINSPIQTICLYLSVAWLCIYYWSHLDFLHSSNVLKIWLSTQIIKHISWFMYVHPMSLWKTSEISRFTHRMVTSSHEGLWNEWRPIAIVLCTIATGPGNSFRLAIRTLATRFDITALPWNAQWILLD